MGTTQNLGLKTFGTEDPIDYNEVNVNYVKIDSAVNERAKKADFDVLNNRIDKFTKLPYGSTSADAELIDIRIGEDGAIYETAGTSVRNQIRKLNNVTNQLSESIDYVKSDLVSLRNVNTGVLNDSRYAVCDGQEYCDYQTESDVKDLIVSIAKTYYTNRGTASNPTFKYDQKKTPLDPAYDSNNKYMDCSTFVQLVISGADYNNSPYCGKELSCNEVWGILPIVSGVRTAAGMAKAFNACGCAVDISDGFDNVEIGDIAFFAKGTREDRYMGISHCTMIASVRSDGTHGMYECTSSKPYIYNRILEKTYTNSDGSIGQSPEQVVLVIRPRYIARAYSDYYVKSEIDNKLSVLSERIANLESMIETLNE